ncbi:Glycoprotein-N-acetylgalactosamine 3-beta-galactosyltransferase 1 [Armadillidium nasatum]|uniref:Glycoprotein-N-acetylgalactosamine 3-beta-galactosyltransferase 1 n=1 Tax=Armadillidium nasatum TaxID=96803 RepID=A0A5N5TN37_9CRUS|nr:Glycoprotein-N-acetylgalactosamine 3-beta-galactosyltransferase 1 [Armadillidium nasatum]
MGSGEDVNMALCLTYIGVSLVDLRDSDGSVQFHIYPTARTNRPQTTGYENMTSQPISFHYVDAETMYLIYYLFYTIHPSNKNYKDLRKNLRKSLNEIER